MRKNYNEYQRWLDGLKAGDPVVIRHPWNDVLDSMENRQ